VVVSEELWILASFLPRPMSRNSVLEELSGQWLTSHLSSCAQQKAISLAKANKNAVNTQYATNAMSMAIITSCLHRTSKRHT